MTKCVEQGNLKLLVPPRRFSFAGTIERGVKLLIEALNLLAPLLSFRCSPLRARCQLSSDDRSHQKGDESNPVPRILDPKTLWGKKVI